VRVLVTGGSGFIGRHVVRLLLARGDEVRVVDRVPYTGPNVEVVTGDLRDAGVIEEAAAGGFDGVVHLAALTSVLESVKDPHGIFDHNVVVTEGLLEACRNGGIRHFVFASTNAVVGDVGRSTINEQAVLHPLTPYGATKAASEMLLSAYSACYGITTVALRYTNVYGAGMQMKDSVIARLMRAGQSGAGIEIYGDGEQLRDYLYVTDAARAMLFGLGLEQPDTITIGGEESISMNTLHRHACEVTGVEIPATHIRARPGEMPAVIVKMDHAREMGFRTELSVRDGLQETWDDFKRTSAAGGSSSA
jgi:UDP-glucose 4-epimerase